MSQDQSTSRSQPEQPPSLFIYGEDQDFRNDWIYHHWALLGSNARSAIWGC